MAIRWPWQRAEQPTKTVVALGLPENATVAEGIVGTSNMGGQLRVEDNSKLTHVGAFGSSSGTPLGEWSRIGNTNPFVAMALGFVLGPLGDASWDVKPDENVADGQKHADFVKWALTNHLATPVNAFAVAAMRGALLQGFSLFEKVYDVVPCKMLGGGQAIVVKRLAERLPSSIKVNGWLEGETNDLEAIGQLGPSNDGLMRFRDVTLPADKVLLFSWQRVGNNYQGVSAFRPVYAEILVQEMLRRLIGVSLQREGAGVPIAYTDDRANALAPNDLKQIQQFLANLVMHEAASAVLPAGWKMDWVYSPGANKGHVVDTLNALGLTILQQLQAQQMVLGTNETGSRAVGSIHASAADTQVKRIGAAFEGVLNGSGGRAYEGLIRHLVELNFGPQDGYPKFCFSFAKPQTSPLERAQALAAAVGAGAITITHDIENELREDLGFAPIDEDERDAIHEDKAAKALEIARAAPTNENEAPPSNAKKPPFKEKLKASAFVAGRPLRPNELHLSTQAIADFLDTARERFEMALRPEVVKMLVKVIPEIHAAMADGDPSEISSVKLDTKAIAAIVEDFLRSSRSEGARQVHSEIAKAKSSRRLTAASGDEKDPPPTDAEFDDSDEKVLQAQKTSLVKRITQRLEHDLETEAIDAVRTGSEASEVVSRTVMRQLESKALRTDAGIIVTRAWNLGRDEAAKKLGATEVEYSAIMDSATCGPCASMDGRTAKANSAEHDAMLPPNRDCEGGGNCRCCLVYIPGSDTENDDEG